MGSWRFCWVAAVGWVVRLAASTDTPIIGVLTTPLTSCFASARAAPKNVPEHSTSCMFTFYSQWLEASGARVVPLFLDAPDELFTALVASVNGILITGGGEDLTNLSSPFMRATARVFDLVLEANRKGEYFPLWGTCMGFQALAVLVSGDPSILQLNRFDGQNQVLNIDVSVPVKESRFLSGLPASALETLMTTNCTANFHCDGIDPEEFVRNRRLASFFRVLSTNVALNGRRYVSTIEAKTMPIYAVQWHPERVQFEFPSSDGEQMMPACGLAVQPSGAIGIDIEFVMPKIPHGPAPTEAMQAVANFFVRETSKNNRSFPNAEIARRALLYRYVPVGSGGTSRKVYCFQIPHGPSGDNFRF